MRISQTPSARSRKRGCSRCKRPTRWIARATKAARDVIAAAKIVVPSMAARVIDRAIQIHGAAGVSQDTFLARAYVYARFIRIGDGPDQVHLTAVGKELIKRGGVMG